MPFPSKNVTLSGHAIRVFGPSEDDNYFQCVQDGLDPEYTRVAEMNVTASGICIDIGANIGLKAMQLAHLAPNGRVVAVEAGPRLHECLMQGVAASGLANLVTQHAAVTDYEGTVKFAENSAYGHIALAHLIQRHSGRPVF